MSDHFIGTAVLTKGENQHLFLVFERVRDMKHWFGSIPIAPQGSPKTSSQCWAYTVKDDTLSVTPSVLERMQLPVPDNAPAGTQGQWVERFHNLGAWSIKFEWEENVEKAYDHLKRINPTIEQYWGT